MGGIASCTARLIIMDLIQCLWSSGAVGALIPDICHTQSKIGRRFPILSKAVSSVFGHRTFTHSLLFLLIMFLSQPHIFQIKTYQPGWWSEWRATWFLTLGRWMESNYYSFNDSRTAPIIYEDRQFFWAACVSRPDNCFMLLFLYAVSWAHVLNVSADTCLNGLFLVGFT